MKYTVIAILTIVLLISSCGSLPQRAEDISVDLNSRKYTAGSAEVQFNLLFSIGGLRKFDLDISYYPSDDVVCLEYSMDFVKHYLFLDRDGRATFVNALRNYREDYEQRTLSEKKSSATKKAYGSARSLLIWEAFRFSGQGRSHPVLTLGYYFVKGSPYFAITMLEAKNVSEITGDKTLNSAMQIFYFTRAQADALADIFEPAYLLSLHRGAAGAASSAAAETDNYSEIE